MKSKSTAFIFWAAGLCGILGLHRFYLGRIGTGLIWLCTLGLFGFGAFIDLFLISGMVDAANHQVQLRQLTTQAQIQQHQLGQMAHMQQYQQAQQMQQPPPGQGQPPAST